MSAGVATDPFSRMQIRIPGWLLVFALVLLVGWWTVFKFPLAHDDDAALTFPARVTSLDSTFENRVLTATVLVEANDQFAPNSLGFALILDDKSQLQASAREVGAGAWHGRSYVFAIDRLIPEGRSPVFLQVTGKNGGTLISLSPEPAP